MPFGARQAGADAFVDQASPELGLGHGVHHRLVHVLCGFDEVGLANNDVGTSGNCIRTHSNSSIGISAPAKGDAIIARCRKLCTVPADLSRRIIQKPARSPERAGFQIGVTVAPELRDTSRQGNRFYGFQLIEDRFQELRVVFNISLKSHGQCVRVLSTVRDAVPPALHPRTFPLRTEYQFHNVLQRNLHDAQQTTPLDAMDLFG